MRRTSLRTFISLVVVGLISSLCGFAASGTAMATSTCSNVKPGQLIIVGEFSTSVRYPSYATVCDYPSQPDWINGLRDAAVRGAQGVGTPTSLDASNSFQAGTVDVVAYFHGSGANGSISTANKSSNNGPGGWVSATKVPCSGPFIPSTGADNEASKIQDYLYHVGQVVKSNSSGYPGTHIAATELVTRSGNRAYYAPHCTNLK